MKEYYFIEILKFIEKIESESLKDWSEKEINAYKLACDKIKIKVKNINNISKLNKYDHLV